MIKRLSILVALCLCVTIGGVYATWVYSQSDDVADITGAKAITMTEATFTGTYGTYSVDTSNLSMVVDPKEGTTHTTALKIDGSLTITFTPNTYAPEEVKNEGVPSSFKFSLSNSDWKYAGQPIVSLTHDGAENITWSKGDNGVFTYTLGSSELAEHIHLTEFTLDTKADYDNYDAVLTNGQIVISISDGKTSSTIGNN